MLQEIRKGLLAGLGAVVLTREKIESATRTLVREAKIAPEDADRLTEELFRKGESQWKEFEDAIRNSVRKTLDNLNIGRREMLDQLHDRIKNLENRISLLEDGLRREKKEGD
jgi:polyhydroxyalkanoate synthesis regulator phasin